MHGLTYIVHRVNVRFFSAKAIVGLISFLNDSIQPRNEKPDDYLVLYILYIRFAQFRGLYYKVTPLVGLDLG